MAEGNELREISVKEAAFQLSVGRTTVSRMIDDGDIDAYLLRGRTRIFKDSVEEYLAEQKAIPAHDDKLQTRVADQRRERIRERQAARIPQQLSLLLAGN